MLMTTDQLRALREAAPHGPWDWTGGYPQRVTNGAATLIAEIFDDPDSPPDSARLIALAPTLLDLVIEMAEVLEKLRPYGHAAEMRWMSVEDSTIKVPARAVAEAVRWLTSLVEVKVP